MMENVLSLLGLAQRAGRLVSGNEAVERAVVRRQAKLVIISQDAAERTAQRMIRLAGEKRVPWVRWASKHELGAAIGRSDRAVVAIIDAGLAEAVRKALSRGE